MTFANRRVFVVLPAAGCGSRMQSDRPKQYLPLGDSGQTVLQTTVLALLDVPEIDGIYVAVSPEDQYVDSLAIPAAVMRTGGNTRAKTVFRHSKHFRIPSPTMIWFWCMMPRAPSYSRKMSPI